MSLLTNLEVAWLLDDASGSGAADASGNSRTGTLINTPTWAAGGLAFAAASSQYINSAWAGPFGTGAIAFAARFATTSAGTVVLGGTGAASFNGSTFSPRLEAGVVVVRCNGCRGEYGSGFNDGDTHSIVITHADAVTMADVKVYIDGEEIVGSFFTGTTALNLDNSSNNYTVGHFIGGVGDYFDGTIYEAYFWTRELTEAEAIRYHNGGTELPFSLFDSTLAVTDFDTGRVFQRAAGTEAKPITMAGTYEGDAPASIEVIIYDDGTTDVVQTWTAIGGLTAAAGNWSGTLTVPQGGWYNFAARSKDGSSVVMATAAQTSAKVGVGIIVACIGQSNMRKMFDTSSTPPEMNALTRRFNGTWGNVVGNGAIRLADLLQTACDCPVGLLDYAVNGSGLVYNDGSGVWSSATAGQPYPLFATGLANSGGDCEFALWHQGEADAKGATSSAAYKAALDTLYGQIRIATERSTSQLKFGCAVLGPFLTDPATDSSVSAIREAHIEWGYATPGGFCSGSCVDMTLIDNAHWDAASYERMAYRYAQAVLYQLGLVAYGAGGPRIVSIEHTPGTDIITLTIMQDGGTALVSEVAATGFEVTAADSDWDQAIESAEASNSSIVITLTAAISHTPRVRYQYGKQPDIDAPVYDDADFGDTIGMPLLPYGPRTASAPITANSGWPGFQVNNWPGLYD